MEHKNNSGRRDRRKERTVIHKMMGRAWLGDVRRSLCDSVVEINSEGAKGDCWMSIRSSHARPVSDWTSVLKPNLCCR